MYKFIKFILLFIYFFLFLYFTFKAKIYIYDINKLRNDKNYGYLNEKIINKIDYRDDLVVINDVIAVVRNVFIYDYNEKTNELTWIPNNKFYNDTNFILNVIKTKNHYINKHYYEDKIELKDYNFKDGSIFYGNVIKNYEYFKENDSYDDLDSFVSSESKDIAELRKDEFIVVDKNILYMGNNYNKPSIGDIIIKYKYFSANNLYFYGDISSKNINVYKNYYMLGFDIEDINFFSLFYKLKALFIILLYFNLIIVLIRLIINQLKKLEDFTLNYLFFFNEYMIYSKNKNIDLFLFFSITILFIIGFYFFIFVPLILLIVLRCIDYYSI